MVWILLTTLHDILAIWIGLRHVLQVVMGEFIRIARVVLILCNNTLIVNNTHVIRFIHSFNEFVLGFTS